MRRVRQQDLRLQAAGASDDRRQVAMPGEIELAIGDSLDDRRPGALEEIPFDLDAGLVLEGVFHIVPGVGGRCRAAAGKRTVVDADRCKAEPDGEGLRACGWHRESAEDSDGQGATRK